MDDMQIAEHFPKQCDMMTIGVIADGRPWVVPVHIATRNGFDFEWYSHTDTVHSQAIEQDPTIAISLYRSRQGDDLELGIYIQATAEKLLENPDGTARYRAVADEVWLNDHTHVKRRLTF